jgi:hypothetical protein
MRLIIMFILLSTCPLLTLFQPSQVPLAIEACTFSPYGDGSPFHVYNGPSPLDMEILDMVDTGPYPVLARSEQRIQVIGDGGMTGWTIIYGMFRGECDDLPFVLTRPPLPGDGCYLYLYQPKQYNISETVQFDTALWETITVPAETYFDVTHYAGGSLSSIYAFQLQLPDRGAVWVYNENTGYGPFTEGAGNCDAVPETYPDDLFEG